MGIWGVFQQPLVCTDRSKRFLHRVSYNIWIDPSLFQRIGRIVG